MVLHKVSQGDIVNMLSVVGPCSFMRDRMSCEEEREILVICLQHRAPFAHENQNNGVHRYSTTTDTDKKDLKLLLCLNFHCT